MNKGLINNFTLLAKYYTKVGDKGRAISYNNAVVSIRSYGHEITKISQVKGMKGIGKNITAKIKEYLDTGQINKVEEYRHIVETKSIKNTKEKTIEIFEQVWGVGKVKAKSLYDQGMRSLEDLEKNKKLLTENQRIGLKYYNDLLKRIPRRYIDTFSMVIAYVLTKTYGGGTYLMDVAGSYRRGAKDSGDIDILVSSKKFNLQQMVDTLKKWNIIVDVFSMKDEKFMGIAQCPGKDWFYFHMDIQFMPEEQYGSGLLYFTGSKALNISMRAIAKKKGLILNHRGLFTSDGKRLPYFTEKEIMNALGLSYVPPDRR